MGEKSLMGLQALSYFLLMTQHLLFNLAVKAYYLLRPTGAA